MEETAKLDQLRRQHGYFCPKGDTLVRQGQPGEHLYVILSGALEFTRQEPDVPRRQLVKTAVAGELFGVTSCFTGSPHGVTATAQSDTRLLRFRRDTIHALAEASPAFAMTVIEALIERLREATDRDIAARASSAARTI